MGNVIAYLSLPLDGFTAGPVHAAGVSDSRNVVRLARACGRGTRGGCPGVYL
jgi:hypothetical protein